MGFVSEIEFENALVGILCRDKGWKGKVLKYPT